VATEAPSATQEDIDKPARDLKQLAKKWVAEISAAEKAQSKWKPRAEKVEKVYNDERGIDGDRARKFNILWSNVETLRPAVYMQTPKAQAVRRYRDRDPVARLAAMMLERCVQTSCELYDFDVAMDQAVRDRLVVGRGAVWCFYAPEFAGEGDEQALAYENVLVEYVPWQDFLHSVARTWAEVRWVARRFYKSRQQLKKWLEELGLDATVAAKIKLDVSQEGDKTDEGLKDERAKAQIWEVWDKESGQVLYVAPSSQDDAIVGVKKPPVKFRDFFPCPRPMLGTTTAKSLIPTPDYALYQDQAKQLDDLEARIGVLLKALSVKGVYASDQDELAQLIEAGDNRMIPVKNWAMFSEGGGVGKRIEWFPIEQVGAVLKGLYEARELAKQTLYEVSGIGDILRGATDPDETATAQGIKAQWGSLRVRRIQKDTQRFAADIMRLKAEVIAEQFGDKTIAQMAGVDQELLAKYVPPPEPPPQQPPDPNMDPAIAQMQAMAQQQAAQQQHQQKVQQFMAQVFALLRDDTARSFRIDVETDSTLEPDQVAEKQAAVEYLTAMGVFMKEGQPLVASGPEGAKLFGEMMLFATRRFDKVDSLEQVIEQAVDAWSKPRPPQPDPEVEKVKAQIEGKKAELQMKGEAQSQELGMKREMHQLDMQAKVQEVQIDGAVRQMEAQQSQIEGQQKLQLQAAQGEQALRQGEQQGALKQKQGEQQMTLAERKAKLTEQQGPPE
jgi:hypothetical protein